jgi:hypothetical protein
MPISFTAGGKPEDTPHALFQIAMEHFVGARLAFVGASAFSASVLMQQCIETGTKALLKEATPSRKFSGSKGHELRTLLSEAQGNHPRLSPILGNVDTATVVDVFVAGYNPIRYGEGVLGMDLASTLLAFDTIAWILLAEVGRTLKYNRPLVARVSERTLAAFLWRLAPPVVEVLRLPASAGPEAEWTPVEVILALPPEPAAAAT